MSVQTSYTLCMRRLGNRNKGLTTYTTALGLSGAQITAIATAGMTIDGRGIVTVLGTSTTTLSVADAAYVANPIAANRPIQRIIVAALPVAVATFNINSASLLDGDATWRLQKVLAALNKPENQMGPTVQGSIDVGSMLFAIRGLSTVIAVTSPSFGYGGAGSAVGISNERILKGYFTNQLLGTVISSGDAGVSTGKSTSRFEYFITNR